MLPRRYINPPGHWRAGSQPYSQAVRCGDLLFTSGQIDLDGSGAITSPDDLEGQTAAAVLQLQRVIAGAGLTLSDLVQLRAFYVQDGSVDEEALTALLGQRLGALNGPGPAISLVPLEGLMLPGLLIELDAIAMRGQNGEVLRRSAAWDPNLAGLPTPFSQALRVGEMVFTSGVTVQNSGGDIEAPGVLAGQSGPVLARLDGLLRQLGADLQDAVKTNVFNAEPGTAEDWSAPALIRASHYREPGPTATGISLPRLWPDGVMVKNDIVAMRGADGARLPRSHSWPSDHWDWPVHLPYRHGLRCGDLVFLGGQVPLNPDASVAHAGDPVAQTKMAMIYIERVLADFGMTFDNVVRITTFYAGRSDEASWRENLDARFAHFTPPGPATTGVPVPWLAYEDMGIEIDIIAMA